jgi:uncharacterized membrane protein
MSTEDHQQDPNRALDKVSKPASYYPTSPPLNSGPHSINIVNNSLTAQFHKGPALPNPAELAGYESVHPGLADRIVAMAEDSLNQKHALELRAADYLDQDQSNDKWERLAGMFCAFFLAGGLETLAYLSVSGGHNFLGSLFGAAGAIPILRTFFMRRTDDESSDATPSPQAESKKRGSGRKPRKK